MMDEPIRPRASVPTERKPRMRPLRSGEWMCWSDVRGWRWYAVAAVPADAMGLLRQWLRGEYVPGHGVVGREPLARAA